MFASKRIQPGAPGATPLNAKRESGFTLVELAIVLVVIGLIIGGVLKGQEMIESARLKASVAQIQAVRAAHITFEDKYGGLAGDLFGAAAILPGAPAWTTPDCNGGNARCDGDGRIEGRGFDNETLLFWQHLATAGMLSGIEISATPEEAYGGGMPALPKGGGLQVEWGLLGANHHWIEITRNPRGPAATLDGASAWAMDMKFDDGRPGVGAMRLNPVRSTACVEGGVVNATAVYDRAAADNSCAALIALD